MREMVKNSAGGFVFGADKWTAMERFLVMGSEGGTYYVSEKELTKENALNTIACIAADGKRAVDLVRRVSVSGLAPNNDAALFALALAASAESPATRDLALAALAEVARIPTHLFHFATYVRQFRGMGRGLKTALASWYQSKDVDNLAFAVTKYQSRDGWGNRDVLRLVRPKADSKERNALYKWITDGFGSFSEGREHLLPRIVVGFESAKGLRGKALVRAISEFNLSREMIPTEGLKDPEVWEALLEKMPPTALIRNLGNLSKCGLLAPLSAASRAVVEKLGDRAAFKKGRVHPMAALIALKQYAMGHGLRGDGVWNAVPAVVDALDALFYDLFDFVEPTGKNILIAVDMSGSMMGSAFPNWRGDTSKDVAGTPLHPCEVAAATALAIAKREKNFYIMGFGATFKALNISPRMRLDEAIASCLASTFGKTDCAVPLRWAAESKAQVDAFIAISDNETYAGPIHASQALKEYREKSGINAKNIVVMTVPKIWSINDPKDLNGLDVSGFSAAVPNVINGFIRGSLTGA